MNRPILPHIYTTAPAGAPYIDDCPCMAHCALAQGVVVRCVYDRQLDDCLPKPCWVVQVRNRVVKRERSADILIWVKVMNIPYLQLVIQFSLSVYALHTYLDIRQLKVTCSATRCNISDQCTQVATCKPPLYRCCRHCNERSLRHSWRIT